MEGCLVKALYDFEKETDADLKLSVGDIIKVIEKINEDWYKGTKGAETGQFPASFAEVVLKNATSRVFIAIADFTGQVDEDITFVKGDLIACEENIDDNWFTGRTDKSQGLCPKSFVEELSFQDNFEYNQKKDPLEVSNKPIESPYGTSVDSFNAQGSDELSFPKGVKIELAREIDSFWTEGIYNGTKGKFPSLFVEVVVPLPDSLKYKECEENEKEDLVPKAKALFMYIAASPNELNFDKGEIITLVERVNNDWLKGKIGNTEGIFPTSYVQIIVDLPFEEVHKSNRTPATQTTPVSSADNVSVRTSKVQSNDNTIGKVSKPTLKPKPALKEKPVLPKQPKTVQGDKTGPLLLTSRKNQPKAIPNTVLNPSQAVNKPSDNEVLQSNVTEKSLPKHTKGPTIIRVAKDKPNVKSMAQKQVNIPAESKPTTQQQNQPVQKPTSPQPHPRSSVRKPPAKVVSIEHNMPLLQTTTKTTSKLKRPPRPSTHTPSPNTQLLEQELNTISADNNVSKISESKAIVHNMPSLQASEKTSKLSRPPRPVGHPRSPNTKLAEQELDAISADHDSKDREMSHSRFYTSDNNDSLSEENSNGTVFIPKRQAPQRPSRSPSKSSTYLQKMDSQASPKLQSKADNQEVRAPSKKQSGTDKSKTLPPRLPKPLAPLPPQKPVAPRSPKPGHTDEMNLHSSSPKTHRSSASQLTTNGKFYVSSVSDKQDAKTQKDQNESQSSMFYVDYFPPDLADGKNDSSGTLELESVEKRIVQIRGQIESEANMLSGIETLLEVSEDDNKKNELLSKKRSLSVSLLDLDEELNACQDEKSYLLASYGDVAAIKTRIKELSDLIDQYQDNGTKLRKMKEVANIDELAEIRDGIEFCDNMIETLLEEMTSLKTKVEQLEPVPQEPVKEDPAETRRKLLKQRQQAIDELIKTEKDYVRDIDLCSTKILIQLRESKSIDCDVLFGNLVAISELSKKLLESLLKIDQGGESNIGKHIGRCFADLAFDLKAEYSEYCRNYDESQAILEKLEQDTEKREEILAAVVTVREETGLWDLSSYLIKPVQRILKYPLILQEIFKYSPDDDEDRSCIQDAINMLKNVANTINEFKRRKDLVQKYQRDDEGIGNKIQRLNWHSVRKKSSRINQKITQFTGLVSQTVDDAFNEEEKRFKSLEKLVKSFVRNLSLYLEYFQENCSLQKFLAEDIRSFCTEALNKDEVDSLCNVIVRIRDVLCPEFIVVVKTRVFDPLEKLLQLFQSPTRLIEKRHDKCLDYDRMLNRVQKLKEKDKQKQANEELILSRKIYEALNSQLLEELPRFSEKCLKFLDYCLANLVNARCSYLQKITEDLNLCLQLHLIERHSFAEIIQKHEEALSTAEEKLCQLIFIPERNLNLSSDGSMKPETLTLTREPASNFYIDLFYDQNESDPTSPIKPMSGDRAVDADGDADRPKPLPRKKSAPRNSISQSPLSPKNSPKSFDDPADNKSSSLSPSEDCMWYVADYSFEKEDDAELSLDEGTVVKVLKKHDKEGNTEWWLVQASNKRGYVPSSYLSPAETNVSEETNEILTMSSEISHGYLENTTVDMDNNNITKEQISENISHNGETTRRDNFVESLTRSKQDSGLLYKAIYDFDASEPGECSMTEGATVKLIKMGDDSGNMEWFQVELNGQSGYVPANYLEPVDDVNS